MPLVTTAELVQQAASRGGGVAAFNVITLEHAEGIAAGARRGLADQLGGRHQRHNAPAQSRCP